MKKKDVIALTGFVSAETVLAFSYVWKSPEFLIVSTVIVVFSLFLSIKPEGYLHPINIFNIFLFGYVLLGLVLILDNLEGAVPFYTYNTSASIELMVNLVTEMHIVTIALYAGYKLNALLFPPTSHINIGLKKRRLDNYWWIFYILGICAFITIVMLSGGFSNLVENLAHKGERAAGRGWLVLLHYAAYVGILLWYRKNIYLPRFKRYTGLFLLLAPLLLYGSRTEFIILLLAALYIDETVGHKIPWIKVFIGAGVLIIFSAMYQIFRGSSGEFNILLAINKDLSMGVGYTIAKTEGFFNGEFHLETFLLSVSPFIPGFVHNFIEFPTPPNTLFTSFVFPSVSGTTFSMGVMGEANYIFPNGISVIYYIALGFFFSWSHRILRNHSVISAAVIAGAAIRFAKGGITAGVANVLNILWVLIVIYTVYLVLHEIYEKHYLYKEPQSST